MLTLIYAANGNQAQALAEKLRKENLGEEFHVRQINAYCGQPEKCDKLIMIDPSPKIEADHKGCEVVQDYAGNTEPSPAPKRRGRQSKSNA